MTDVAHMDYLARIGLLAHCLLVPMAWGLLVEWVFHVIRTHRAGEGGIAEDLALPEPLGWSCQL